MAKTPELSRFQDEHERMLEMLTSYQCALMEQDLGLARGCAESLLYEFRVHRGVEDEVLMPLFQELGLEAEGARLELFAAEHEKLGRLALGLVDEVGRLEGLDPAGQRDCLEGIEAAIGFKHLFDHHTKRENAGLYPALGAAVSGEQLDEVWCRMDAVEERLRLGLGPAPAPVSIPRTNDQTL
ncbi:MAG: hemerythrin domain-containing protein [Planctomycetota bacterium]|nr:hemerythrin domain-containing protein [Planctomycetota bacterium]